MQTFKENMNLNVIKSDSQDIFMRHLENIDDPEQKEKLLEEPLSMFLMLRQ